MPTFEDAKAYAIYITGGTATYACICADAPEIVDVRVRLPDYRVVWVSVWIDPVIGIYGEW
jgi:hypothetical protein